MTILRGGWTNHPVSKMWKDYKYSLCDYLLACEKVLKEEYNREYPDTEKEINSLRLTFSDIGHPSFIGNEDFHASHRSKLLFKGSIFGLTDAITNFIKTPYKKWKGQFSLPERNEITIEQRDLLKDYCNCNGIVWTNWYSQFGWTEPDNLPYIWPV